MASDIVSDLLGLLPPLILMVLGMIVLLWDLGLRSGHKSRLVVFSLIGVGIAGASAISGVIGSNGARIPLFGGGMVSDPFGNLFNIVLCVIAALSLLMSDRYIADKNIDQGEYYALVLFSTAGAMLMAMANDLVNVFLGLEVLSVALYILSGLARREVRSQESAVKYFLLGAFATGFLLYGTALVYGAVGLEARTMSVLGGQISFTNFDTIRYILGQSSTLATSPVFGAGVALLIVGLGFKAAIVPFHLWTPDVYEGAPTPVTAFMSAGAKAGAFAAFIRLFEMLLPGGEAGRISAQTYGAVLWGLAAATMIVGNVLAVRQTNIKRMLAYSSIAHAGYILVGVLAYATQPGNDIARGAVLYYMFAYTFMNLGAFAVVIWLGRGAGEYVEIRDYAGLAREQPLAAATMAIFMLSLAGIPPAAGFFGKLYLFLGAVHAGQIALACLGLLVSVIGVYYYLNIIVQMYFRQPEQDFSTVQPRGGARIAAIAAAAASLILGIITVTHFTPGTGMPKSVPPPGQLMGPPGGASVPPR